LNGEIVSFNFLLTTSLQVNGAKIMRGVQFVVNEAGKKTAVLLDLQEWGELWEDFYDILVSQSREQEDTISWDALEVEIASDTPQHD
jgi:hypothetical protein